MQPLRFAINVSLDGYCARTSIGWRSVPYADLSEARVELVACPRRLRAVSRPVCRFPDARRVVIVGREEIVFPWHGGQSARCHGDSEQRSPRCLLLTSGCPPQTAAVHSRFPKLIPRAPQEEPHGLSRPWGFSLASDRSRSRSSPSCIDSGPEQAEHPGTGSPMPPDERARTNSDPRGTPPTRVIAKSLALSGPVSYNVGITWLIN